LRADEEGFESDGRISESYGRTTWHRQQLQLLHL
jgi:hypothetical protein